MQLLSFLGIDMSDILQKLSDWQTRRKIDLKLNACEVPDKTESEEDKESIEKIEYLAQSFALNMPDKSAYAQRNVPMIFIDELDSEDAKNWIRRMGYYGLRFACEIEHRSEFRLYIELNSDDFNRTRHNREVNALKVMFMLKMDPHFYDGFQFGFEESIYVPYFMVKENFDYLGSNEQILSGIVKTKERVKNEKK